MKPFRLNLEEDEEYCTADGGAVTDVHFKEGKDDFVAWSETYKGWIVYNTLGEAIKVPETFDLRIREKESVWYSVIFKNGSWSTYSERMHYKKITDRDIKYIIKETWRGQELITKEFCN